MKDYGELEASIRTVLERDNLQQRDGYVLKVIQLFETVNVRFGVMLVGPTGGGKTTCYRALAKAMTRLRQELRHPNEGY